VKPRTHCKQARPLRHEDGTLTANAHRRADGRGVECQTCKHGKVPKAALLRAQGWVGGSRRPRQTLAQEKARAEQEAARQAAQEAQDKGDRREAGCRMDTGRPLLAPAEGRICR
jgi:hypothetical protein